MLPAHRTICGKGITVRKLVVLLATSVALIGTIVGVAVADPGLEPAPTFAPHRHFIEKANGTLLEVGPRVCEKGADSPNWGAFLQFHSNHHSHGRLVNLDDGAAGGLPGPQGPIAPGINDGNGPKLAFSGCPST